MSDTEAVWTLGHWCATCERLSMDRGEWVDDLFGEQTAWVCFLCTLCRYCKCERFVDIDMGDEWRAGFARAQAYAAARSEELKASGTA